MFIWYALFGIASIDDVLLPRLPVNPLIAAPDVDRAETAALEEERWLMLS